MTSTIKATGIFDLPFADYRSLDAWGSGSLKAMRRGPPARVMWERENGHADSPATILGTAVHCALLTPDLYQQTYAVKPEGMSFASKEGKAWRDDPVRAGRTLLSYDVGQQVDAIKAALFQKRAVRESISLATHREASLVWSCSVTRELCKARPDWMEGRYIYDLKVSRHAGGGYLALRAYSEGWLAQLAHYRTGAITLGLNITGGRLVVVDPAPPHFVHLLEAKLNALDLLELENIETLKLMRECRVANNWPGTSESWSKVDVPASANMEMFNDVVLGAGEEETETEEVF